MIQRFTNAAIRVLIRAQEEARTAGNEQCASEFILLALTTEKRSASAKRLSEIGLTEKAVRQDLSKNRPFTAKMVLRMFRLDPICMTEDSEFVLGLARKYAEHHLNLITTEHLLLGIIMLAQGGAFSLLQSTRVDLNTLKESLVADLC